MPGILIIAHAPLASSLKAVAMHAYPDRVGGLEALDVTPDMSLEVIEQRARELLSRVRSPQALVLTDVFGASPCNVAQRLSDGGQVRVVAGVNVPMLWRSLCYADETLDAMVSRAVSGATQGVMQVGSVRPQNQAKKPGSNDQETNYDQ
jgi:mannose PTS system EIIA component